MRKSPVNTRVGALFAARESSDRDAAYQAFVDLMALADKPVDWSYEVWDRMVGDLSHRDGHRRAFAAQMLARLAISDPENRMRRDFAALAAVMKDEKVSKKQSSSWKAATQ
jgi:predicted component of type VI protein secretion system